MVDHHPEPFVYKPEKEEVKEEKKKSIEELMLLAEMGEICATTDGTIVEVRVKEGDEVKEGDIIAILEAMKMLNNVTSPVTGKVKQVPVKEGQQVKVGDLIARIKPKRKGDS
jgi:biotin carboxyl carrier protein